MAYANLRPSQATLDPENPRLPDGTSSDREAINRLIDDGADALINLARDMARTGQTNPAELPIAVKQGRKYLILEGNRRFAALKLLKDPALADLEAHQQAFRRAAGLGTPPKSVFTLVSASREEAEHWIVLRHTGENNGRGVKRWSASQTAIHRSRANRSIDSGTVRSITIADELEEVYASDSEIVDLVRKTRSDKLTNIGRFFSPDVLKRLGLSIHVDRDNVLRERSLWARHTPVQLREFFAWAILYIYDNSVDAYKNAEVRRKVLDKVPNLAPSYELGSAEPRPLSGGPTQRSAESTGTDHSDEGSDDDDGERNEAEAGGGSSVEASSDSSSAGQKNASAGGADSSESRERAQSNADGGASTKREARPEKYLFQELRLPSHDNRIQTLLREARALPVAEYPGIACVMVRVMVELSVSAPAALALSGGKESDPLKEKILRMLRFLNPSVEHPRRGDKELAQAY